MFTILFLQVRDEIEHLLDDNHDMAQLYLTRKWLQNQQSEVNLGATAPNALATAALVPHHGFNRSGSLVTSNAVDDSDVEDLEMLLEAYFMQLDGTRNRILSVSFSMMFIVIIVPFSSSGGLILHVLVSARNVDQQFWYL